jgi:hypothetical protein
MPAPTAKREATPELLVPPARLILGLGVLSLRPVTRKAAGIPSGPSKGPGSER